MKRAAALAVGGLAAALGWFGASGAAVAESAAPGGPALKRSANLPDGAPAFDVLDARGQRVSRIDCIWNGWYDADALATRLLASPAVMAAVVAKGGRIAIEDLGPAVFDCTVAAAAAGVAAAAVVAVGAAAAPVPALPQVSAGRIERLADFPSKYVDARHVDVWLPDGYGAAGKRYKVLYMHDGQMLFDPAITWNKQAWHVDATLARLLREGKVADTLVVAIWNNGRFRHSEYFPHKFLRHVSPDFRRRFQAEMLQDKPQADNYLRFLVEELKPAIDSRYATLPGREHTLLMGSSMGGAISVYAMNEYPQVFGGAAGLSLAWAGMGKANFELPLAAFDYLREHLAPPAGHRLYMDHGDGDMDAWFANYQVFVDEIVRDKGYTAANLLSLRFPGTGHTEQAWAARLETPLRFLLGAPLEPPK